MLFTLLLTASVIFGSPVDTDGPRLVWATIEPATLNVDQSNMLFVTVRITDETGFDRGSIRYHPQINDQQIRNVAFYGLDRSNTNLISGNAQDGIYRGYTNH